MSTTSILISMVSIGVCGSISEKLLSSFGKQELASFVNIASLSSVGLTGLGLVIKLLQLLASL